MKTLSNNYYGTSGQNGTSGGNGGPGVYALNIGAPKTGGGHYLPSGTYATGANVKIIGGAGGAGATGITSVNSGNGGGGGAGGAGVLLGGGTLGNSGTILGGAGGAGGYGYFDGTSSVGSPGGTGGAGGVGVEFTSAAKLINHSGGKITGGVGGVGGDGGLYGGLGGVGGSGGVGVILGNGTLTNAATITGGVGGAGGYGGSPPEGTGQGGTGDGGAGGGGAAGVTLVGGVLTNTAAITGGAGGQGGYGEGALGNGGAGAAGGSGAYLLGGTLTNHSSITGGVGGVGDGGYHGGVGGSGGTGVLLKGGTLLTTGNISGGTGGAAGNGVLAGIGGAGGPGATELSGALTNLGSITGGVGGVGGGKFFGGAAGGSGGAGVLLGGGTLTNSGIISGGHGGTGGLGYAGNQFGYPPAPGGPGGNGGAGAYLNGGTLTTSGTIYGGAAGPGGTGAPDGAGGAAGDAVQFGSVASALVVEPGAVFNGLVAANASVNDVLKLSGVQSGGTPITLGTQFTNFSTLVFAAGAHWTVDAGTAAAPGGGLAIYGFTTSDTIDVTNLTPAQALADFTPSSHTLSTASDGTLHFVSGPFSGESFLFSNDGTGGTDLTVVVGSALSSVLTSTVTLGGSAHPSPLTISNAGGIAPSAAGANALVSTIATNSLTNHGVIAGAAGSTGSTGGTGGNGAVIDAGTVTNSGSISGGAGGAGTSKGGHGGSGVVLNGGMLITSGTIARGASGSGPTTSAAGDSVLFGTVASTLVVDPGAAFTGLIGGFGLNDTVDVTDLTPAQALADFNASTHTLTTPSDGTLAFVGHAGDSFLFSNDGTGGTDLTVVVGSALSSVLTSTVTLGGSAHPSPLTISNAGGIAPSAAGANALVSTIATNSLTNHGVIAGAAGSAGSTGGSGGNGAVIDAGTVTNSGSISGGAGGAGTSKGGHGGSGVVLNGGMLITSGTIARGASGSGPTTSAAGDAVLFGTTASTLVVDPGALFTGQVVANNVHDVLELAGSQSGGTPITLGTQFSTFSMLDFASGAAWTADATLADLIAHPLSIDGFTTADTLDLASLSGAKLSFNTTSDVLTLTKGATTVHLQFDSAFTGDHFVLTANGTAANLTLTAGASAPLAALAHDPSNFVGAEHYALMGDRFMLGDQGAGSGFTLHPDPAFEAWSGHGFSANAFPDHSLAHASVMLK